MTDKKEALFFILHYYKAYPTLQKLGMYFGLSNSAASY
ncbi:MAG: transposase family protein [Janthinobacterium lividum]